MRIREADLARDRTALLAFIVGSQHFEHAIEPNRRLDSRVAEDHLGKMLSLLGERPGQVFVAADDTDQAIGWGIVVEQEDDIYVVAEERRYAYIAELFVEEPLRGSGIGRALIAACEDWCRARTQRHANRRVARERPRPRYLSPSGLCGLRNPAPQISSLRHQPRGVL